MPDEKPEPAENSVTEEAEAVAEEKIERVDQLQCPRCEARYMKRIKRAGFAQKVVYPIFGYYPWRCTKCLGNFLLKQRSQAKRRRAESTGNEPIEAAAAAAEQN